MQSHRFFLTNNRLPNEIQYEIVKNLDLQTLGVLAGVNQFSHQLVQENYLWQKKFERHFPHRVQTLRHKNNINWLHEFKQTYQTEYTNLSSRMRKLFGLVKESRLQALQQMNLTPKEICEEYDSNQRSVRKWAQGIENQAILDHFFHIIMIAHQKNRENQQVCDRSILFHAITCQQAPAVIAALLATGSNLHECYHAIEAKPFLVHMAARFANLDTFKLLVEKNRNILGYLDSNLSSPLFYAVDNPMVLNYLLGQPEAMIDAVNVKGLTPLLQALKTANEQSALMLIHAGATIEPVPGTTMHTLHLAAGNGMLKVVKKLVTQNPKLIDVSDAFVQGVTPLLCAVRNGQTEVVKYLLQRKPALINKSDNDELTPLMYAMYYDQPEVAKLLLTEPQLDLHAKTNSTKHPGWTALHFATYYGYHRDELVKLILKRDPNYAQSPALGLRHLNEETIALFDLKGRIETLHHAPPSKKILGLFKSNTPQKKLAAAEALWDVVVNESDKSLLDQHKHTLKHSSLSRIYHTIRPR